MGDPVMPRAGGVTPFAAKAIGVLVLLALAGLLALWGIGRYVEHRLVADPPAIAGATLTALREQNRLSAFAARLVAVTTSRRSTFAQSAERTLIMPGIVRYEVDLTRLTARDVTWNAATRTLSVRLPPIDLTSPEIDAAAVREYRTGGTLAIAPAGSSQLDAANRRAGQADLIRQARDAPMRRLARDATARAIERSFALPLRANGLDIAVRVRFADEPLLGSER